MPFVFDSRPSDSPYVETIWHTQSDSAGGSFISIAATQWELVVTRQRGQVTMGVRGPETRASVASIPEDAEFLGILFKLGSFLPALPSPELVDGGLILPQASDHTFWLHGSAWQFPDFENTDTFVDRLVRQGLLAHETVVTNAVQGQIPDRSLRSVQRRFLRATGMTHGTISQIHRARHAMTLLQQGVSIVDTVDQAGYADQPHLTRSLKRFIGQTPAQLLAASR
ncbi:MAG: helix-turn-helix transcriptional regulator [Chloroflexi bacterium]|nr:helix-turn-helix transcriptional regulator [Chloroflexota bacterium]